MYAPFLFTTSEKELHYVLLHRKESEAFPMHWHDEIEIDCIRSGELRIFLNGESRSVRAGEAVIINSGDPHYWLPSEAEVTSVIFSPDVISGTEDSSRLEKEIVQRIGRLSRTTENWKDKDRAALIALVDELERIPEGIFSYELLVRSALFRILALAADENCNPPSSQRPSAACQKVMGRIGNVFRYIEEHYSNPISLPEAAAASGYVPTYFSRVFKSCTGMTFYDYLTLFRVRKAEAALITSSDSIAAIAVQCGFSSVKTFDRVFKEHAGISPLKFRKRHRQR